MFMLSFVICLSFVYWRQPSCLIFTLHFNNHFDIYKFRLKSTFVLLVLHVEIVLKTKQPEAETSLVYDVFIRVIKKESASWTSDERKRNGINMWSMWSVKMFYGLFGTHETKCKGNIGVSMNFAQKSKNLLITKITCQQPRGIKLAKC